MMAGRNPPLQRKRGFPMLQFAPNDSGQEYLLKQRGKDVDMADQDQIVDRACVGDDQLHKSESQALQVVHIAAHVLNGDVRGYPMVLQKAVEFVTGPEAQQTAQLRLRYALQLVFLEGETFQNSARQIAADAKAGRDFVRNFNCEVHVALPSA